jgi:N-acetylmuramoyl-L-alanine amidase
VVVPEADSVSTYQESYRFNASTLPGSMAEINGIPQKVYPNGAFATYLPLKPGANRIRIVSKHPESGEMSKSIVINSIAAAPEKETEGFAIEYARLVPALDQKLTAGELVQARVKATPGCKLTFLDHIPMVELPATSTRGIRGIYQGSYQIRETDVIPENPVQFTLENRTGEKVTMLSRNTLSANSVGFPAVGLTTGTLPYLNYGLGEDRLGGAKICYIDTLIKLSLTGKTGNLYHVKLSNSQMAYIPDDYVKILPAGTFAPLSLSSSWSLSGDNKYDILSIGLSERLPFISKYEINPLRIVVDIFGASSNTNWITQLNSAKEVKNAWYEQPEKNVLRVIIELKHQQAWGYSVFYRQNSLTVKIRQMPEIRKLNKLTIGLDAGHGGDNNGALGSTGVKEKDINLSIVNKLKNALEKEGAKVVLSRPDDAYVGMTKRWQIWHSEPVDLALSIHNNSIGYTDPTKIKGTSTYYKHIAFRSLSKHIYDELLKTGLEEFGNVGSFNFFLNGPTAFPNALVEVAYLSHPEDEILVTDPKFQDKVVGRIIKGLKHYLKE